MFGRWRVLALLCAVAATACGSESDPASSETVDPVNDSGDGKDDDGADDGAVPADGNDDDDTPHGGGGSTNDGPDGTGGDDGDTNQDGADGSDSGSGDGNNDGDGDGDASDDGEGGADDGSDVDPIQISDTCTENRQYVGQTFEKDDKPNNGGEETLTPYPANYDAGLSALVAAAPSGQDPVTVDLAITEATVVATSFGDNASRSFWLQDGKAGIQVYLPAAVTQDGEPVVVRVGSKVSAKVTKLAAYFGQPQVVELSDFEIAAIAQPVFIDDRTGKSIALADAAKLVRVTGVLEGEGVACGGSSKCWTLNYAGSTPVTFRSASQFVSTGSCVTFVGPVTTRTDQNGTTVQLDTVNYDWVWSARQN